MLFGPVLAAVIETASSSKPFAIHLTHPSITAPCAYAIGPKIPRSKDCTAQKVRTDIHKLAYF